MGRSLGPWASGSQNTMLVVRQYDSDQMEGKNSLITEGLLHY
jgi:hypothetical protein